VNGNMSNPLKITGTDIITYYLKRYRKLIRFLKSIKCFFVGHSFIYKGRTDFGRFRICKRCEKKEKHGYYNDHDIVGYWEKENG
jgi:hypothetical protein